jgi:four helix bundle protein
MYRVAKQLPDIEKFGLAGQMRRAALSLTNNIAESHGRYHYLDQIKFSLQLRGSLEQLIDGLNVCEDESYLPLDRIISLRDEPWRLRQLADGYIRYLRGQKDSSSIRVDSPAYHTDREGSQTAIEMIEDPDDSRFTI